MIYFVVLPWENLNSTKLTQFYKLIMLSGLKLQRNKKRWFMSLIKRLIQKASKTWEDLQVLLKIVGWDDVTFGQDDNYKNCMVLCDEIWHQNDRSRKLAVWIVFRNKLPKIVHFPEYLHNLKKWWIFRWNLTKTEEKECISRYFSQKLALK